MQSRFSALTTSFTILLALPAAVSAQQGARGVESFTPAEESALEGLGGSHATEYSLINSWYAERPIQYYHFGATDPQPGTLYRVAGGAEIVTSLPGTPGYSAVRQVLDVTVLPGAGVPPAELRSHLVIIELLQQGRARLKAAGLSVNVPIVPDGSSLERDPARRGLRTAYYKGRAVHYFDFGITPPTAIPLIAFAQKFPAPGQDLEPVEGQPSNASAVPGVFNYSDLWNIQVAVGSAYKPGSYRDFRRVQADSRAGRILVRPRKMVVNCPVIYVDGKAASRPGPALPPALVPSSRPAVALETESARRPGPDVPVTPGLDPAAVPAATPAADLSAAGRVYSGRAHRLDVALTRAASSTAVTLDGVLDEPVWQSAALLTGFSQFQPQDGLPADDSTEVLVFYTDHAIYFGIRAFEPHGAVRANLADRDKIDNDDNVQIFLDTFNDHRRALVFSVNALGSQSDGTRNEGGATSGTGGAGGGGGFGGPAFSPASVDLSEDFQYQSKGRLTDGGYQIEVRVPFKSLRYQTIRVQDWGIQVLREVQHSGHLQTWTPARRAGQSFLAQSGKLRQLSGLKRGLVLDLNPVTTGHVDGTPPAAGAAGWNYGDAKPELGGNVRWGITTNLTLNGTAKPDFSQVEADVQQQSFDPRAALSYPEKRPFFVEGSERFDAPNQLIYTRRIVQPVGALKLSGKVGGTNLGFLSALDDKAQSTSKTDYPVFNILRLKRDLGQQSTVGFTYTDRINGPDWNRVVVVGPRIVFSRLYALSSFYAHSFTRAGGVTTNAPMWKVTLDRSGRRYGFNFNVDGTHPLFQSQSGFVRRVDISNASITHRFTWFGKPRAALESYTFSVNLSGNWWYDSLLTLRQPNDPKLHFNNSLTLRGGWGLSGNIFLESFRYDPTLYAAYYIERTLAGGGKDTIPYPPLPRIKNLDYSFNLSTPQFETFTGSLNVIGGWDENFFEWSPAQILVVTATADWRPTNQLRVNARYPLQMYIRMSDKSAVGRRQIPRLKVEYQATRAVFLRFVGQYDANFQDALRDDSRTGFPILLRDSKGVYSRATSRTTNNFRVDWLFSFQPNPGTVFFAGYGASLKEPEAFRFADLTRTRDGFFAKLSYLYRL